MDRAYNYNGKKGSYFKILPGKPRGKRPLGRPRLRWEYNIRIDLKEVLSVL